MKLTTFHDTPVNYDIKPIINKLSDGDSLTHTTVQVVSYPYLIFMRSE